MEDILKGTWQPVTVSELRAAPFDERLSVMGLVLSRLSGESRNTRLQDGLTTALHAALSEFKARIESEEPQAVLTGLIRQRQEQQRRAKEAGHLDRESRDLGQREINLLETYRQGLAREALSTPAAAMDAVRDWFSRETELRKRLGQATGAMFANAFRFLEEALGQSQELVIFVTEITAGYDTSWFVENFGCEAYFRHNQELLFDGTRRRIRDEIAAVRAAELEEMQHE